MRKRLIYRADDVGYTQAFNDGAFRAMDEGIVTSADIMLDTPGTVDALERIRNYPWISVGWHRHLWGVPVAGAENVPSMVNAEGRFKGRHDGSLSDTTTYEDAYREFVAEVELCISILGRAPDTTMIRSTMPIDVAFKDVCDKYGIAYNYWKTAGMFPATLDIKCPRDFSNLNFRPKSMRDTMDNSVYYDLAAFKNYDAEGLLMDVEWSDDTEIRFVGGHPGYLDEYILAESSCSIHRVKELAACISPRVKQWIIDNKIELINQRDLLNGTNEFQNHLRNIDSPLSIDKFK